MRRRLFSMQRATWWAASARISAATASSRPRSIHARSPRRGESQRSLQTAYVFMSGCSKNLVFVTDLQHRERRLNDYFDCVKEAVTNELRAFDVNTADVAHPCVARTRQDLQYTRFFISERQIVFDILSSSRQQLIRVNSLIGVCKRTGRVPCGGELESRKPAETPD